MFVVTFAFVFCAILAVRQWVVFTKSRRAEQAASVILPVFFSAASGITLIFWILTFANHGFSLY